jgi:hypothetical protein
MVFPFAKLNVFFAYLDHLTQSISGTAPKALKNAFVFWPPGSLFYIIQLTGTSRIFMQYVIDVLKGLLKYALIGFECSI